jgi:DNA processing protein
MKDFFSDKTLYFWLAVSDASPTKVNACISHYGGIRDFYEHFAFDNKLKDVLGNSYDKLKKNLDKDFLTKELEKIERAEISFLTPLDEKYPKGFLELNDAPFVIFYKGRLELLQSPCFTVVGTRNPSNYGKKMTKLFAQELSRSGLTIVSGMATGIDAYVHRFTLEVQGDTIAILGNGHNEIYPAVNYELYNEISQKGLVISEFLPDFKGTVYSYPRRNRLLSALSMGVLVVEAGEKSGTMYTVEYALEQGRNVFVLTGAADNTRVLGNLRLIRNSQCAMVYEPRHILEELNIPYTQKSQAQALQLDFNEQKILDLLANGELHYDNILYSTDLAVSDLNSLLTIMEIKGLIAKNGTMYFLA